MTQEVAFDRRFHLSVFEFRSQGLQCEIEGPLQQICQSKARQTLRNADVITGP